MADAATLSPEVSRERLGARPGARRGGAELGPVPAEHPAVRGSLDRLRGAIADASGGQRFAFGVTPDTLLVAGIAVGGRDAGAIAEAARAGSTTATSCSSRFAGEVPACRRSSGCSACWRRTRASSRQRGGPGQGLGRGGRRRDRDRADRFQPGARGSRRHQPGPQEGRPVAVDRPRRPRSQASPTDEATQRRLLEISGDVIAIGELADDVIAPHHTLDGSPMLTSQAAAVVAAYRHLVGDRRRPVARAAAGGHAEPRGRDREPQPARRDADALGEASRRSRGRRAGGPAPAARRRGHRRRDGRQPGRAAAGDDAGDRRPGVGAARDRLQHHRDRRRPQDARPHADAPDAERDRLRPAGRVPEPVVLDGRAAAHLQREAVRLGVATGPGSTRSARAPSRWRRTCRRSSRRCSIRSDRTTCAASR